MASPQRAGQRRTCELQVVDEAFMREIDINSPEATALANNSHATLWQVADCDGTTRQAIASAATVKTPKLWAGFVQVPGEADQSLEARFSRMGVQMEQVVLQQANADLQARLTATEFGSRMDTLSGTVVTQQALLATQQAGLVTQQALLNEFQQSLAVLEKKARDDEVTKKREQLRTSIHISHGVVGCMVYRDTLDDVHHQPFKNAAHTQMALEFIEACGHFLQLVITVLGLERLHNLNGSSEEQQAVLDIIREALTSVCGGVWWRDYPKIMEENELRNYGAHAALLLECAQKLRQLAAERLAQPTDLPDNTFGKPLATCVSCVADYITRNITGLDLVMESLEHGRDQAPARTRQRVKEFMAAKNWEYGLDP